jgi:hypothetical protein
MLKAIDKQILAATARPKQNGKGKKNKMMSAQTCEGASHAVGIGEELKMLIETRKTLVDEVGPLVRAQG